MDEIFKRILDKLAGADFWIALVFLAAGYVCWRWIGTTTTDKKKVQRRQIGIALLIAVLAGAVILMNHLFFLRERGFSKNLTGVLVTRIVDDDALNSLQGDLVEKLNAQLQKEEMGHQIEVHASSEIVNENYGLKVAHERARAIGRRLNAKIVIWGRKIGVNKFYPRITVMANPKGWSWESNRTHDMRNITEFHLPDEVVDEPFYLIHFVAGYSYYIRGDYKEALPHFKAALRREGALPLELADLQFFTAFCLYALGVGQEGMAANLQEAAELLEKAAKIYESQNDQENFAVTQSDLGQLYLALTTGDRATNLLKAVAVCSEAIRFNPKDADAFFNRGFAYQEKGEYEKAISDYNEAIRLDPENATAYNNRGIYYSREKGDYNRAIADHNEAIRLDPKSAKAYSARGFAYQEKGDYDKAIADYNEAIRLNPKNEDAYDNRGLAHQERGEYEKAIADHNEAIRLNPKQANAYFNRGRAYRKKGDYDKAIAEYNEIIRLDPKDADAYNALAWMLGTCIQASFRNGKKAVEYATKACELSEWKDLNMMDTLAAAYAEAEDFNQAIKWETKYLETPNLSEKDAADGKSRLALYQAHKPYHTEK